ncbi:MAG: hypothetical protein IAE87_12610, partial [Rhodobacteraceae bacterium]|nr:hypothetical protein [Paracoccaceae bacterium]
VLRPVLRPVLRLAPVLALVLPLVLAACVGNLHGATGIAETLAGRVVVYGPPGTGRDEAMWQDWQADGRTRTGGPSVWQSKTGRWTVVNGTYCEIFGASSDWTCWRITLLQGGRAVRFWEVVEEPADLLIFHRDMTGWFAG